MTGYIMDKTGTIRELPVLLGWEIEHGMGQPCDAFTAECLYEPEMLPVLKRLMWIFPIDSYAPVNLFSYL